jgi:hypothetical protein
MHDDKFFIRNNGVLNSVKRYPWGAAVCVWNPSMWPCIQKKIIYMNKCEVGTLTFIWKLNGVCGSSYTLKDVKGSTPGWRTLRFVKRMHKYLDAYKSLFSLKFLRLCTTIGNKSWIPYCNICMEIITCRNCDNICDKRE